MLQQLLPVQIPLELTNQLLQDGHGLQWQAN